MPHHQNRVSHIGAHITGLCEVDSSPKVGVYKNHSAPRLNLMSVPLNQKTTMKMSSVERKATSVSWGSPGCQAALGQLKHQTPALEGKTEKGHAAAVAS